MAKLVERAITGFREYIGLRDQGNGRFSARTAPEDVYKQMEAAFAELVQYSHEKAKEGQTVDQITSMMTGGDAARFLPKLHQYRKTNGDYSQLYNMCRDLNNLYDQELKADLVEKRRFLRYRIYTAIGIALVIFLTATLSHLTGIPLPMIRNM